MSAEDDAELVENASSSIELQIRTDVDEEGTSEGLPGRAWRIVINAFSEGHPDEDQEGRVAIGAASAYIYPSAATNPNFAFDMDASDEPVAYIGETLQVGAPTYGGHARKDLFCRRCSSTDILMVGEIEIDPKFSGLDLAGRTVETLQGVIGQHVGLVAVMPVPGDPDQDEAYWESGGHFRPAGNQDGAWIWHIR